jgi:phage terminase large subunit-like protein
VSDLTSFAACWAPNPYRTYLPDKYLIKIFSWVPQSALESVNGNLYSAWIHSGYLKLTSGNSVDYQEILHDLCEFSQDYPIIKLHYDEWNATSFV